MNTRSGSATKPVSRSSTTEPNAMLRRADRGRGARLTRSTSPPIVDGSTLPTNWPGEVVADQCPRAGRRRRRRAAPAASARPTGRRRAAVMSRPAARSSDREQVVPVGEQLRRGSAPCSTSTPSRATLTSDAQPRTSSPGAGRGTTGAPSPMARQPTWAAERPSVRPGAASAPRGRLRDAWARAHHDGRRRRARGRGRRARARGSCSCTASAARRRTSPTTSPRSRRDHTVVVFDHRGHGESDKPDDLAGVLARPARRRHARGRRRGRPRPRSGCSGTRWAAWSPAGSCCEHPSAVDALVLMDTSPGPMPGFDPELMEFGARRSR